MSISTIPSFTLFLVGAEKEYWTPSWLDGEPFDLVEDSSVPVAIHTSLQEQFGQPGPPHLERCHLLVHHTKRNVDTHASTLCRSLLFGAAEHAQQERQH